MRLTESHTSMSKFLIAPNLTQVSRDRCSMAAAAAAADTATAGMAAAAAAAAGHL
jgi:hypothetical protein